MKFGLSVAMVVIACLFATMSWINVLYQIAQMVLR
jgi:hypothetical protein